MWDMLDSGVDIKMKRTKEDTEELAKWAVQVRFYATSFSVHSSLSPIPSSLSLSLSLSLSVGLPVCLSLSLPQIPV